jgi:CRP-like cAMP-binding protein
MSTTHVAGEPRVPLLEVDPDLARHLAPDDAEQARAALTLPVVKLPAGRLRLSDVEDAGVHPFAGYVVSGLLTRDIDIGAQPALELLGPGGIFVGRSLDGMLPSKARLVVTSPARIALLDDRLLAAVRHWPRLVPGLMQRLCEQRDRLALQLVISHQPRVEDRLVNLFWHLSDRFGSVTAEGISLPMSLTHEALGRLIGARRPTVTLALRALDERGVLRRRDDRSWLLTTWPEDPEFESSELSPRAWPMPLELATT